MKTDALRLGNLNFAVDRFETKRNFPGAVHALRNEIGSLSYDEQIDIRIYYDNIANTVSCQAQSHKRAKKIAMRKQTKLGRIARMERHQRKIHAQSFFAPRQKTADFAFSLLITAP